MDRLTMITWKEQAGRGDVILWRWAGSDAAGDLDDSNCQLQCSLSFNMFIETAFLKKQRLEVTDRLTSTDEALVKGSNAQRLAINQR